MRIKSVLVSVFFVLPVFLMVCLAMLTTPLMPKRLRTKVIDYISRVGEIGYKFSSC